LTHRVPDLTCNPVVSPDRLFRFPHYRPSKQNFPQARFLDNFQFADETASDTGSGSTASPAKE